MKDPDILHMLLKTPTGAGRGYADFQNLTQMSNGPGHMEAKVPRVEMSTHNCNMPSRVVICLHLTDSILVNIRHVHA